MGTFLEAQWSRLCASKARGLGSTPGWETKIPHGVWRGKKKKKGNSPCLPAASPKVIKR